MGDIGRRADILVRRNARTPCGLRNVSRVVLPVPCCGQECPRAEGSEPEMEPEIRLIAVC